MADGLALVRYISAAAFFIASSLIAFRSHSERAGFAAGLRAAVLAVLEEPTIELESRSMMMAETVVDPTSNARY